MIKKQAYDIDEKLIQAFPESEERKFKNEEGSAVLYRTKKEHVNDPYIFYIQCMAREIPDPQELQKFINSETTARHITKEQLLEKIVDGFSKVDDAFTLDLRGEFVDALQFDEESGSIQVLCETTEEIIFFNWNTTA